VADKTQYSLAQIIDLIDGGRSHDVATRMKERDELAKLKKKDPKAAALLAAKLKKEAAERVKERDGKKGKKKDKKKKKKKGEKKKNVRTRKERETEVMQTRRANQQRSLIGGGAKENGVEDDREHERKRREKLKKKIEEKVKKVNKKRFQSDGEESSSD
jgi:hypothetical protein